LKNWVRKETVAPWHLKQGDLVSYSKRASIEL